MKQMRSFFDYQELTKNNNKKSFRLNQKMSSQKRDADTEQDKLAQTGFRATNTGLLRRFF